MKCDKCGFDSDKSQFRYLYNVKIDESISYRECPKCYTYVECDELAEERRIEEKRTGSKIENYVPDSSGKHASHELTDEKGQAVSQNWGKFREQWMKGASKKGVSRDKEVPDKACGYCENFTPSSYAGSGSGTCNVLKIGSDLATGVYVTEGDMGMPTMDITDGGQCKHFKELEHVDTNTSEVWSPLQRTNRLFKEK